MKVTPKGLYIRGKGSAMQLAFYADNIGEDGAYCKYYHNVSASILTHPESMGDDWVSVDRDLFNRVLQLVYEEMTNV